ncbi:MAG: hypothetical protein AAGA08_19640 [Pseudomonadota bacterium]
MMQIITRLMVNAKRDVQYLVKDVVYIADMRYSVSVYRALGECIKGLYWVST